VKSLNFWKQIPAGDNPPEFLNMVIEVNNGSRDKFEYKSEWEAFVLNRIIPSSVVFPVEYGFVPQTFSEDGDPLDIMALTYEPLEVGTVAKVRVIGLLVMEDEKGLDNKILSVLLNDLRFEGYKDLTNVPEYQLKEIQEFFTTYKRLEPCKWAKVKGWKKPVEAKQVVLAAMECYQELK
jgi:inorganic pyrophosphatase